MPDLAYAPKAGREDPDHFGAVFVNDQKTIDVRQALADGNGYIVTADADEQRALDGVDSLKHVTLDEARGQMPDHVAQRGAADDLDARTKDELLRLDEAQNVPRASGMKVDELRDAIRRVRTENEGV